MIFNFCVTDRNLSGAATSYGNSYAAAAGGVGTNLGLFTFANLAGRSAPSSSIHWLGNSSINSSAEGNTEHPSLWRRRASSDAMTFHSGLTVTSSSLFPSSLQSSSSVSIPHNAKTTPTVTTAASAVVDAPRHTSSLHTAPHVLRLFYSRDGHLLFVLSTDSPSCKCGSFTVAGSAGLSGSSMHHSVSKL
ncbi:unnamed protein product [Protopolystoma xenopodis]|uniref:Uncharacterized protein n=1 Tax=Protopolystoma xenopodis TaxID=117903 RepID=A0A448WCF2_9PLAT|nr:unnamed protein product [Protopolystoma xenopodis]